MLITATQDQNPAVIQVPVVLEVNGRRRQLIAQVAGGRTDDTGLCQAAIAGRKDIEATLNGVAVGLAAVLVGILLLGADQQIMLLTEYLLLADEVPAGITRFIIVMAAIGLTPQHAAAGQRARLGNREAVAVVVPAVGQARFPVIAELVLETRGCGFADADRICPFFVQALVVADIGRMAVREYRATIEGADVVVVFVSQRQAGALSGPGQRWRDQRVLINAIVTPVVLALTLGHQAVGQPRVAQRAGGVDAETAAAFAVRRTTERGALHVLRLFTDHIDHATRLHCPVQQRGRTFEYFNAFGRGPEIFRHH